MNYNNVVVFDGVCNLCNWGVKFIIRRDYKNKFLFTSIQSNIGPQLLLNHGIQTENIETFLLIKNGKPFTLIFRYIPKGLRDFAYRVIARNRYKLFGKKDQCMIPSPDIKAKFLD
jgi:predicted DCC family thiol-disulfide oxidoreductase YuxK